MNHRLKNKFLYFLILLVSLSIQAQHFSKMQVTVDSKNHLLHISQDLVYNNTSNDTIDAIVLNDWNNAFSSKNSALAKRFSNEFIRSFHLAKEIDRGYTQIHSISDFEDTPHVWERPINQIDLIKISPKSPILPCEKRLFRLKYTVKIPNEKFTKYGFDKSGTLFLKHWYLSPALYENKQFVMHSNENLDDIPNAKSDFEILLDVSKNYELSSNLLTQQQVLENNKFHYFLQDSHKTEVLLHLQDKSTYFSNKNEQVEVSCGLKENNLSLEEQVSILEKVTTFTTGQLGPTYKQKLLISQEDYDRQPIYGLNQLPEFLNLFDAKFLYELKLLKTYLNNYLKENLQINPRNESWLSDGIQIFLMMKYIEENYPNTKISGNLAHIKLLKPYHLVNLPFNQQYHYVYLLMARKNLDQALNEPKNNLIKFNVQIANKYKAGLSFNYLDHYLEHGIVSASIKEFMRHNLYSTSNTRQFETIVEKNAHQKLNWFFRTIIDTREIIDYKFGKVTKTKDSITFNLINKTHTNVPISLYVLKDNKVINKMWLQEVTSDSTLTIPRLGADKIVLNYNNEVPEYNLRNNWKSLKGFRFSNKPFKLNFFKDIENPHYNQLFYMPEFGFNAYDGIFAGMMLSNRSLLNKPFLFSATPMFSSGTNTIVGKFNAIVEKNYRDMGRLYTIRYIIAGSRFHYTPDAFYTNVVPIIQFRFRDKNLRNNKSELFQLRQVYVNREKSIYTQDISTENYSIFNAKYSSVLSEGTQLFYYSNDLQLSNTFGKLSAEIQYRKLFENNRQISVRCYFGTFIYNNSNSDFFNFGLDRPNDYLFDYDLLGRSETKGLYSQQYVYAEGGFKSKLANRFANQWMGTINTTCNIWNWIQIYGDAGLIKNKSLGSQFVFDSGVHLNLVPDYFELYFPVYSSNGFAGNYGNYGEKIRFVVTLSPKTLVSLFTRKWF